MKYITVLDFEVGQVFQYDIEGLGFNPDTLHESCEEFLTSDRYYRFTRLERCFN